MKYQHLLVASIAGAAYGQDSSNMSTGPIPIPNCSDAEPFVPSNTSVTLRYINEIATLLSDDVKIRGQCWTFFKERIFGSLQLSEDLLVDGPKILQEHNNIESDAFAAMDNASKVKGHFMDAFGDCEEASCMAEYFCENYFDGSYGSGTYSESTSKQLKKICIEEGWRFQDLIQNGSLDGVCEFSIVKMPYTDTNSAECTD